MTANHERETAKIYVFPVKNGAKNGMPPKEAVKAADIPNRR